MLQSKVDEPPKLPSPTRSTFNNAKAQIATFDKLMYDDDDEMKVELEPKPHTENAVEDKTPKETKDKKGKSTRRRKRDHKYYQDLKEGKAGVKSMTEFEKMGHEIETPWMAELYSLLSKYNFDERKKKAARHFKDALHVRKTRHDIEISDKKWLKRCYQIQIHNYWQNWLYFLSWIYIFLAIFEPSYEGHDEFYHEHEYYYAICIAVESVVIFCYLLELFMEIAHRHHYPHQNWKEKYVYNLKMLFKIILTFLFTLDYIIFHASLPRAIFRFSRVFRPYCLALFKKELRRTFNGIIRSMKAMVVIMIFFFLIILILAFFGARIIGEVEDQDDILSNFGDFEYTLTTMYVFLSRDNYPDIMLPAFRSSPLFGLFFIPFLLFDILLLVPIPIATMFEAFKTQTGLLVVKDRIKEREALFSAFLCMDLNFNMKLEMSEFQILFNEVYNGRAYKEKVTEIFHYLDEEEKGYISLKNFFNIVEAIENTKDLVDPEFIQVIIWNKIRYLVNKIFRFDVITNSQIFETLMTLVILVNAGILIAYTFPSSEETTDILDEIDSYLVYVYLGEVVIKVFGMGIIKYFSDGWNILDFILTIVSIVTQVAVSVTRFAKTARASKFLKSLRAQRAIKMVRIIRSVKIFKFCFGPNSILRSFKKLLNNIVICLPIVAKLTIILFMITYSYAVIGMQIFNHHLAIHEESHYIEPYVSFDDIGTSLLCLFHIINQAEWGKIEYDHIYRYETLGKPALFFNSYHAIAIFVVISLLTGLIWEIFNFMSENLEEQNRVERLVEDLTILESEIKNEIKKDKANSRGNSLNRHQTDFDRAKTTPMFLGESKKIFSKSYIASEVEDQSKVLSKKTTRRYSFEGDSINLPGSDRTWNAHTENSLRDDPIRRSTFAENLRRSSVVPSVNVTIEKRRLVPKFPLYNIDESPVNGNHQKFLGNLSVDNILQPKEEEEETPINIRALSMTKITDRTIFKAKGQDPENMMNQLPLLTGDEGEVTQISLNNENQILETEAPLVSTRKKLTITQDRRYSVGRTMMVNLPSPGKNKEKAFRTNTMNRPDVLDLPFEDLEYIDVNYNQEFKKREMFFFIRKFSASVKVTTQRNQMEFILDKKENNDKLKAEKLFLKLIDEVDVDTEEIQNLLNDNALKIKETKAIMLRKIETQKRRLLYSIPNSERIIRKALLRGANKANIQEYEEEHMKSLYGKWFENLQEKDMSSWLNIFEAENHCIIRMTRLMKQITLKPPEFLEILHLIESSINQNLLQQGSMAKFIFNDCEGNWFFTYQDQDILKFHKLKYGFWNHYDEIFTENNTLYEAHDVLSNNFNEKKFDDVNNNFFIGLKRMSRTIARNTFHELDISENSWDCYAVPFQSDDYRKIRGNLYKTYKNHKKILFKNIGPHVTKRGLFISISFGTKVSKKKSDSDAAGSTLTPRASKMVPDDEKRASIQRLQTTRARKKSKKFDDDILKGKKEENDIENIVKRTKENEYLPSGELLEFLKDVRDILNYNREYFLTKMSAFYLLKNSGVSE